MLRKNEDETEAWCKSQFIEVLKQFVRKGKFLSLKTDIQTFIFLSVNTEDIYQCILDEQETYHGREKVVVGFIQGKTNLEVKEFFQSIIPTDVIVNLRHDNTTKLLSPIGYLSRTHPVYSVSKKYVEVLHKAQRNAKVKLVTMNVRRGLAQGVANKTPAQTVYVETDTSEETKQMLINQQEYLVRQGVYFVPRGEFSDISALTYKANMYKVQELLNSEGIK